MTDDKKIVITKESQIAEISKYMTSEGISVNDLEKFQGNLEETKGEPEIRPSELEGVSNAILDNAALTAKLVELERRLRNLIAAEYPDKY